MVKCKELRNFYQLGWGIGVWNLRVHIFDSLLGKNTEVLINKDTTAFMKAAKAAINDYNIDCLIIYLQAIGFRKKGELVINLKFNLA